MLVWCVQYCANTVGIEYMKIRKNSNNERREYLLICNFPFQKPLPLFLIYCSANRNVFPLAINGVFTY